MGNSMFRAPLHPSAPAQEAILCQTVIMKTTALVECSLYAISSSGHSVSL